MDGVLTDFIGAFETKMGKSMEEVRKGHSPGIVWGLINKGQLFDTRFWADMPWLPDGKFLWQNLVKYTPTILTAPPRTQESRIGKTEWVHRELHPTPEIIIEAKKYLYAKPNHILIDDTQDNITRWEDHGGIGILHIDAHKTLAELHQLLRDVEIARTSNTRPTHHNKYLWVEFKPRETGATDGIFMAIPPIGSDTFKLIRYKTSKGQQWNNANGSPTFRNQIENYYGKVEKMTRIKDDAELEEHMVIDGI